MYFICTSDLEGTGMADADYQTRLVDKDLDELLPGLPAIALEGPKGVGKTATARRRARTVYALDDPTTRELFAADPARLWAAAATGDPLTMEHRAQIRASAVWVVERATSVVAAAYRAGGGTSLYSDCPLQRRLRDIHALAQHFIVRRDTLVTAGAILAGQDVHVMVF